MGRTSTLSLDYRRPGAGGAAGDASRLSLTAAVKHRERAYQMAAWAMLAGGAVALLLGPAIVTAIFAKVQTQFVRHALIGAAAAFALAAAILIPVLFWFERLTRGQWFENEARGGSATVAPVPVAGVFELLLWGPRMVFAATERRRQTVSANVLTDAAATIAYLRHFADAGVGTNELPTIQPAPVLRYLASREWVDISPDGRRVWLHPDARRTLGFDRT